MSTETLVRTACPAHCPGNACGILAHVQDGQVTKVEPFCVLCCEANAIHFGDLSDPQSRVSQLITQRSGYILKPAEKTDPTIYYLPPLSQRPV